MNDVYVRNNRGYWVVGSISSDSQMLIKNEKIEAFKKVFGLLNAEHTIDDLAALDIAGKDELLKIISRLEDKGLLEGSSCREEFNEAERLSIRLFKYDFKEIAPKTQKRCEIYTSLFKIAFFISIVLTIFCFAFHLEKLKELTLLGIISYKTPSIKNSIIGYLLINSGTYVMFFLHEAAHSVVAIKNKIRPHYAALILHLGFLPMCYVKLKNIYSLKKKQIYSVLLAGVFMNLFLFFVCMDLYLIFGGEFLKIFAASNFKMFYINLVPLSLTDGYFIAGLLFNMPNVRMRFFKCLAFPGQLLRQDKNFVAVFMLNLLVIAGMLNFELYILSRILGLKGTFMMISVISINIVYFYVIHLINRLRFKKQGY